MTELTCIVCPMGCSLSVDEASITDGPSLSVRGNRCLRGAVYAQEEICFPKRVVTATCAIAGDPPHNALHRVPVKTSAPCPKGQILALLADVYSAQAMLPVKAGDTIIADWKGSGIDVVATRNIM